MVVEELSSYNQTDSSMILQIVKVALLAMSMEHLVQ